MRNGTKPFYSLTSHLSQATPRKKITSCYPGDIKSQPILRSLRLRFPSATDACWRCHSEKGTYLNTWWECTGICPFWLQIFQFFTEIYDEPLTPSPSIALLSLLPGSIKSQKASVLKFFLSVGRQLIPRT